MTEEIILTNCPKCALSFYFEMLLPLHLRMQENTQKYSLLRKVKEGFKKEGQEFIMDDALLFMFNRKFRKKKLEEEEEERSKVVTPPPQVDGATSSDSPTKSEDSGLGSDEENIELIQPVVKRLVDIVKM